jgi:hypothetical protein
MDRKMAEKKYEKPSIIYREKIEARAGSCVKAGTSGCDPGPFVS